MSIELSRRHLRDRPMRNLTDDELNAILIISNHIKLLADDLADQFAALAELASMEDGERI